MQHFYWTFDLNERLTFGQDKKRESERERKRGSGDIINPHSPATHFTNSWLPTTREADEQNAANQDEIFSRSNIQRPKRPTYMHVHVYRYQECQKFLLLNTGSKQIHASGLITHKEKIYSKQVLKTRELNRYFLTMAMTSQEQMLVINADSTGIIKFLSCKHYHLLCNVQPQEGENVHCQNLGWGGGEGGDKSTPLVQSE